MGNYGPVKKLGLGALTEREWQQQVLDLCAYHHLKTYHTYDSRRSTAGFPDLTIVGRSTVFAELKSEKGKVSAAQHEWIVALNNSGVEAHVWRPSDMPTVRAVLAYLAKK